MRKRMKVTNIRGHMPIADWLQVCSPPLPPHRLRSILAL
jgi:hypothetical protein